MAVLWLLLIDAKSLEVCVVGVWVKREGIVMATETP